MTNIETLTAFLDSARSSDEERRNADVMLGVLAEMVTPHRLAGAIAATRLINGDSIGAKP